ncbi:MAG TPA: WD40 repeat domain-containing protein, partial [Phototrophicaceae bacterium]|nr:WD40 repeat domain-containing protein [Phototrophicaceae bacterium]
MNRFILLCLTLLTTIQLHPQTDADLPLIPPQIMQLGRGTAVTLDWHPDGDVLAVGGSLGIWLYDDNLEDLAHFSDASSVTWLAWSPYGNQLATSDQDNTVKLWDVNLDSDLFNLNRSWKFSDDSSPLRFYWAPEGERLAVITSDGAQVFDVDNGETFLTIPDLEFTFAWHPDGTQIAGMIDLGEEIGEQVRVWDATTGEIVNTYTSADPYLFWSNIQWSPDGSVLVGITSVPATLHVWSMETGDLLNDVDTFAGEFSVYFDMWWIGDGEQLVTVSRSISPPASSILDVWNTENWTPSDTGFLPGDVRSIKKRPNVNTWALLTSDGQIELRNLTDSEPLQVRAVYSQPSHLLTWSSDNQHLAGANSIGESISIWDVTIPDQPQMHIATIPYRACYLDELRWSASDDTLIGFLSIHEITAPGAFSTAFILKWDSQTGELLRTLHETPGYVAHDGSGDYLPGYTWSDDFTRVVTEISDQP